MDSANLNWDSWLYRIGCPVWGCKEWGGVVYPQGTSSSEFLTWYSRSFPTVEGNSTFYAVPPTATFEKWRDQTVEGFRFCFKFPKSISHDKQLSFCDSELKDWLHKLSILEKAGRLGPTFLQMGPSFAYRSFDRLEKFLRALPRDWPWAVELRHSDWFDAGPQEARLEDLLRELNIDRVLFDSRPLNSQDPSDVSEAASQTRKPKSPFRTSVTGTRPMVRLIGRNSPDEVVDYWRFWAQQIHDWIQQGLQPWIFTHAPDDRFAPQLVHLFESSIQAINADLPSLPRINTPNDAKISRTPVVRQLELF
ncbi:DUF72 domain-containing protein [Pirellulaceae bacterium SH449]